MMIFPNINALKPFVGKEIGRSESILVDQALINQFAKCTFDEQWIHTDPSKSKAYSPYSRTIAHGYLILSLHYRLSSTVYQIQSLTKTINYGSDKVRFILPVLEGSMLYLTVGIQNLEIKENGTRLEAISKFYVEGTSKAVCISENILLLFE